MNHDKCIAGICFTALDPAGPKFFGFSEFLAALALLVLVWTTTDIRYRFRVATAPVPLHHLTFWVVGGVGSLTLLTDLWRASGWFVLRGPALTPELWQAILGAIFLLGFLAWAWFAYLHPPEFGRRNAERYADFLYPTILNASPSDMALIGQEMIRSIPSLVAAIPILDHRHEAEQNSFDQLPKWQGIAHDTLLLIADPRFCRALVASSPGTIYAFFYQATKTGKRQIPIGQFGRNVVAAAIENRNSFLYHEQSGYASGLFGYTKPLSQAMFGDYGLVDEADCILDLDYEVMRRWSKAEWNVYASAVILVLASYIERKIWDHSFVLHRAFEKIAGAASDLYKIDGLDSASWEADAIQRLEVSVVFCEQALKVLDAGALPEHLTLRIRKEHQAFQASLLDNLADLMLKIIEHAEVVRQNSDLSWSVRHNVVWGRIFDDLGQAGPATRIVQFKLRRKIYNEIITTEQWPNYRNVRLLGFCLHMMGFSIHEGSNFGRSYRALHRAVLAWTTKNFVALQQRAPQVFEVCLPALMSYDMESACLVRTYESNALRSEPQYTYLRLHRP